MQRSSSDGTVDFLAVAAPWGTKRTACGAVFDVTKPTPFNGEHTAGPVAFISVPNATTNLGPLCTDPNKNTVPVSCNP